MAEVPFLFDFSFAAQPGGNWPAVAGGSEEELGSGETALTVKSSARAEAYIEVYSWQVD